MDRDRVVAENVMKLHRYRTPGEPPGTVLQTGAGVGGVGSMTTFDATASGEEQSTEVYERNRDWTAVDDGLPLLSEYA